MTIDINIDLKIYAKFSVSLVHSMQKRKKKFAGFLEIKTFVNLKNQSRTVIARQRGRALLK